MDTQPDLTQDELWKSIIEDFFSDLMHYFFPESMKNRVIRQVEFLDTELHRIISHTVQMDRRADKLVRMVFENGEEKHLLIHIEVQGYFDPKFNFRMFSYYYKIFDSVEGDIESLVIFTFPKAVPKNLFFERKTLNTLLHFKYDARKVWEEADEILINNSNPFALVLLTAKEAVAISDKSDEQKMEFSIRLLKRLDQKGYSPSIRNKLYHFIINYLKFSGKDSYNLFEEKLTALKQERTTMGILELVRQKKIEALKREFRQQAEASIREAEQKAVEFAEHQAEQLAEEANIKTARNFLRSDAFNLGSLTIEVIAEATSLPLETVKQLKKEIDSQ